MTARLDELGVPESCNENIKKKYDFKKIQNLDFSPLDNLLRTAKNTK